MKAAGEEGAPFFGSAKISDFGRKLTRSGAGARGGVFGAVGRLNAGNRREGTNWRPEGKHSRREGGKDSLGNCGGRRWR